MFINYSVLISRHYVSESWVLIMIMINTLTKLSSIKTSNSCYGSTVSTWMGMRLARWPPGGLSYATHHSNQSQRFFSRGPPPEHPIKASGAGQGDPAPPVPQAHPAAHVSPQQEPVAPQLGEHCDTRGEPQGYVISDDH